MLDILTNLIWSLHNVYQRITLYSVNMCNYVLVKNIKFKFLILGKGRKGRRERKRKEEGGREKRKIKKKDATGPPITTHMDGHLKNTLRAVQREGPMPCKDHKGPCQPSS